MRSGRFAAYPRAVTDSDAAVTKAENDLSVLLNLEKVFQSFAAKAEECQHCPLCTRGFENAAKTDEFKTLILNRIHGRGCLPSYSTHFSTRLDTRVHHKNVLLSRCHGAIAVTAHSSLAAHYFYPCRHIRFICVDTSAAPSNTGQVEPRFCLVF